MLKLTDLIIPLEVIYYGDIFILLRVIAIKGYLNGKATDEIVGYKYEVVDTDSYEKFAVKVSQPVPTITQEEIDKSQKKFKVSFSNAVAKPYRTQAGSYELSIKADAINVVTN